MKVLAAIFLVLHGFAHLVGFVGAFGLGKGVPHQTTVLAGKVDLGEPGIRAVGALWALVALAFAAAAFGLFFGATWTSPFLLATTLASLALCAIHVPEAKIGLVIDVFILLAWIAVVPLRVLGGP